MKKLIVVFCLISCPVFAQQQIEYTVKLTGQELDLIGEGLGTQPFKVVAPLLQKMREQIAEQQVATQKQKEEPK